MNRGLLDGSHKIVNRTIIYVATDRYLFIDAYNVIHANEDLRRVLNKDLDNVRNRLAERVSAIHDAEGVHTVLALDSNRTSLEVEYPFGKKSFEFVYAPARLSADGVIEQLLTRVKDPANVTVASNDAMVRECARVNKAISITAQELFDWASSCEQRLLRDAEQRRKAGKAEWRNGIDPGFKI